ncbi:helix-turn-helix domain-containing protein [Streptomyces sp. NPDC002057]|uniref:AraC family transcriptional regulator n=1 Tax=Streptomyces sp. NPDC002057 TaxID=3154664 RepID=UPI00331D1396
MRRHMCPRGDCELVLARPDSRLRPGVIGYRGYRLTGGEAHRRLFAPEGSVSLFLTLDGEMTTGHSGEATRAVSRSAVVYGPHMRPKVLCHRGVTEGIEVSLLPWVARRLFDASMGELADAVVEAGVVMGRSLPHLTDAMSAAPDWRTRFALLDLQLLRWTTCAGAARAPAPSVLHAWDLLTGTAGTLPIHAVAARTQWSRRQLEIRFREQIGLTPKRLARALRLDRAIGLLSAGGGQAETAAVAGFCDQAHLAREFRALTGMPPGLFLDTFALGCPWPAVPQDEGGPFASVQDPEGGPFAFVQDPEGGPSPDSIREGRTTS